MQKPVVEPPQVGNRLQPGGSGPVVQCVGRRLDEVTDPVVDLAKVGAGVTVKDCGVAVARAAGEELGTDPVYRLMVNVGTVARSPFLPVSQTGSGKACRLLMVWWWGGGSVVVRGRESRLHGEGTQRVCRDGTGMPGGRR